MLKFGWSKRDVSIDGPVLITGQAYERISGGVYDPNQVTALVIDDGNTVSILMSGDFTSITDGLIHEVRAAIRQKNPAIPAENVLFSATHTHTAPRYMRRSDYDKAPIDAIDHISPEQYRKFLVEQASDAVVEAYENRQEGAFSYGYDYAVVAHHRRSVYRDDPQSPTSARMYGDPNDPTFCGFEGNVDNSVYFLFTFDAKDRLTGAIVNVPCPSQCSELEGMLSADYWAQVRALAKEKYGDIYILPQCAAAGDMAPRVLNGKAAQQRKHDLQYAGKKFPKISRTQELYNRIEIAKRIMAAFDNAYEWATKEKIRNAQLQHTVKQLQLKLWKPTEDEYRSAKNEAAAYASKGFLYTDNPRADFSENTFRSLMHAANEAIIHRYESDIDTYTAEIHAVRLGDVAFVSNPFELFLSYQHRIQARSPFVQTFVIQLAASVDADYSTSYLCTAPAAANGGYGASIFSCTVAPAAGDVLVDETLQELQNLQNNARISPA